MLPTAKVFHHAPISDRQGVEYGGWFVTEYAAPDRAKAWATLVRIGRSEADTYRFKPCGLDRGKTYRVTFNNTGETAALTGLELARDGLPIRLPVIMSSELLLFESE